MYSTTTSKNETAGPQAIGLGSKGAAVRRLQEWLNLHKHNISIDGQFGPATQVALRDFQNQHGLKPSPTLTTQTWNALVGPMTAVLSSSLKKPSTVSAACLQIATAHLAEHPQEAGGDNCGPWVRLYTGGSDGPDWRWCAGFTTFVMQQACSLLQQTTPIKGSVSCDSLAAQANAAQRFVTGKSLVRGTTPISSLGSCAMFLIRRTASDWTHTGFAFNFSGETFETIEGNTNDEGSSNGYEVCKRIRRLDEGKDFIKLD